MLNLHPCNTKMLCCEKQVNEFQAVRSYAGSIWNQARRGLHWGPALPTGLERHSALSRDATQELDAIKEKWKPLKEPESQVWLETTEALMPAVEVDCHNETSLWRLVHAMEYTQPMTWWGPEYHVCSIRIGSGPLLTHLLHTLHTLSVSGQVITNKVAKFDTVAAPPSQCMLQADRNGRSVDQQAKIMFTMYAINDDHDPIVEDWVPIDNWPVSQGHGCPGQDLNSQPSLQVLTLGEDGREKFYSTIKLDVGESKELVGSESCLKPPAGSMIVFPLAPEKSLSMLMDKLPPSKTAMVSSILSFMRMGYSRKKKIIPEDIAQSVICFKKDHDQEEDNDLQGQMSHLSVASKKKLALTPNVSEMTFKRPSKQPKVMRQMTDPTEHLIECEEDESGFCKHDSNRLHILPPIHPTNSKQGQGHKRSSGVKDVSRSKLQNNSFNKLSYTGFQPGLDLGHRPTDESIQVNLEDSSASIKSQDRSNGVKDVSRSKLHGNSINKLLYTGFHPSIDLAKPPTSESLLVNVDGSGTNRSQNLRSQLGVEDDQRSQRPLDLANNRVNSLGTQPQLPLQTDISSSKFDTHRLKIRHSILRMREIAKHRAHGITQPKGSPQKPLKMKDVTFSPPSNAPAPKTREDHLFTGEDSTETRHELLRVIQNLVVRKEQVTVAGSWNTITSLTLSLPKNFL